MFSLAQTKLPWYIILIYPGIALLISGALSELLGGPRTLAACAFALAVFYFRLPAIVDGSPDVKQFAKGVTQIVPSNEAIYVYSQHEPEINGNVVQHNYRGAQNLRPALIYYLDHPLVCVDMDTRYALERASQAYVIVHTQSPGPPHILDSILLRQDHYTLARSKELSFHRC